MGQQLLLYVLSGSACQRDACHMEAQQLLRDSDVEPTGNRIAEGLGAANSVYVGFVKELEGHSIQIDWRYYNDGKAWLGKSAVAFSFG